MGLGVGIVAPWTARQEIASGELIALPLGDKKFEREWGYFCQESRHLSMVEEDFLRISRNVTKAF